MTNIVTAGDNGSIAIARRANCIASRSSPRMAKSEGQKSHRLGVGRHADRLPKVAHGTPQVGLLRKDGFRVKAQCRARVARQRAAGELVAATKSLLATVEPERVGHQLEDAVHAKQDVVLAFDRQRTISSSRARASESPVISFKH